MEKCNKTPEKILRSDRVLSPIFLNSNLAHFNNKLKTFNLKKCNKLYSQLSKKDFIISKDKILTNNSKGSQLTKNRKDLTPKYQLKLIKNEVIKIFSKNINKNKNPKNNINKIDIGVQIFNNSKKQNKSKNFQILKKLIDHSNNTNFQDIDCILESPHRGVEKIGFSLSSTISSEKNKNHYHPIFVDNNYKGYFYKRKYKKQTSSLVINSLTKNIDIKKINNDKYNEINKNKEMNNPLKRLSIISGVSCIKLRKVIDFSLNHRINNLGNLSTKKINNNLPNTNVIKQRNLENQNLNKNKGIYSMIILKSKSNLNSELNKQDSISLDSDFSFEGVIGNKFFKDKSEKNINNKRYNNSPIKIEKDIEIFKNTTIKNRIGAFYK